MKKITLCALVLFATSSCNIWEPFDSTQLLEAASKCLSDGDYACAIAKYTALTDANLKAKKLCTTYMTKAGITTDLLINTMQESSEMLGKVANKLIPWNATKASDAANAVTQCTIYKTAVLGTTGEKTGKLLSALSNITDCAMRMARTDLFQGVAPADACDTPNLSTDGKVDALDIGVAVTGALPGMCDTDAAGCETDMTNVSQDLQDAGTDNLDNVPTLAGAESVVRLTLRGEVP